MPLSIRTAASRRQRAVGLGERSPAIAEGKWHGLARECRAGRSGGGRGRSAGGLAVGGRLGRRQDYVGGRNQLFMVAPPG